MNDFPHEAVAKLWTAYLEAETRAPRAEKLRALEKFLHDLTALPAETWFPWARSLAERVVDREEDFIIRMSLFRQAVFPALLSGLSAGLPGCARWLAGLARHLYSCRECQEQLPPEQQTETGLLRTALQHAPQDTRARRKLIQALAGQLRHALHELPSGVLHGMDGATPEQCLELMEEVAQFSRLVAEESLLPKHADLIDQCRLHFTAYRDYLLHRGQYSSYGDYLDHRK